MGARSGLARTGRRMVTSGAPAAVNLAALAVVPFVAAYTLDKATFATWALVATIATAAANVDLGGPVAVLSRAAHEPSRTLRFRAARLSVVGSAAVTAAAVAVWLPYQAATGIASVPAVTAVSLLAATGAASALRSVVSVDAAWLLAVGRHRTRSVLLVSGALGTVSVTAAALAAGVELWALPAGIGVTNAFAVLAVRWQYRNDPDWNATGPVAPLAGYAKSRLSVSALTMTLTQADRWIVGAVAGPSVLAGYELALRAAIIPKMAATSVSQVVVGDASTTAAQDRGKLARDSVLVTVAVVAGMSAAVAVAVTAVGPAIPLAVFAVLLAGHGIHAVTAPLTGLLAGIGRPEREIPYLVIAVIVTAAAWYVSASAGGAWVTAAVPAGLVAGTGYLVFSRPWTAVTAAVAATGAPGADR